jgi:uncharacterized protein (TIGR03382 family)
MLDRTIVRRVVLGAAALVGCSELASATDVLVSMRYDSLAGSYNSALQQFNAHAVDTAALRTTGAVSRLVPVTGTALFQPGFVSGPDLADFVINISVVGVGPVRSGSGTFVSKDRDGDMIAGDVAGTWVYGGPGFIFFNGTLSNVFVVPSGTEPQNATFDGSSSGSWNLALPAPMPYEGAIVQLVFGAPSFFDADFTDRATGVNIQLVPAPGAMSLMGLGALAMFRRRR